MTTTILGCVWKPMDVCSALRVAIHRRFRWHRPLSLPVFCKAGDRVLVADARQLFTSNILASQALKAGTAGLGLAIDPFFVTRTWMESDSGVYSTC
jgi:hypothetical protein